MLLLLLRSARSGTVAVARARLGAVRIRLASNGRSRLAARSGARCRASGRGTPAAATFRGYEPNVVQELVIHNHNARHLRARYDLPSGGSVLSPFPQAVLPVGDGHFGANPIAYILDQ